MRRAYLVLGGDAMDRQLAQRWMHRGAVINLIDSRKPPADEPRLVTLPPRCCAPAKSERRSANDSLPAGPHRR